MTVDIAVQVGESWGQRGATGGRNFAVFVAARSAFAAAAAGGGAWMDERVCSPFWVVGWGRSLVVFFRFFSFFVFWVGDWGSCDVAGRLYREGK